MQRRTFLKACAAASLSPLAFMSPASALPANVDPELKYLGYDSPLVTETGLGLRIIKRIYVIHFDNGRNLDVTVECRMSDLEDGCEFYMTDKSWNSKWHRYRATSDPWKNSLTGVWTIEADLEQKQ